LAHEPPQSTSLSFQFRIPSMQFAATHVPNAQAIDEKQSPVVRHR
jgi:hypothetical protein